MSTNATTGWRRDFELLPHFSEFFRIRRHCDDLALMNYDEFTPWC